ncbi:MAG: YqgE/AlgH family protein [Mariniblastus sp.]
MDSLAGHLLIAIPDLNDSNFHQTVVVLFQHDNEGASGVILNRPSDVTVAKVWREISEEGETSDCQCEDFVHVGGPVEGPLIGLHTSLDLAESPVIPGVFISMGRKKLNQLVTQNNQQFKIFSGYSGWGPKQLESEIEQGGWLTLPAKQNHLFQSPDELWKQVCDQVGNNILRPHLGKHRPSDPSLN